MIHTWLPALAPALVATVLLVVPGLIVNLGLGARGLDALGLAPLTSLGVLALATLMVPAVVGRWSLAAVAVSLVIVTLIAVLGRLAIAWWTGRGGADRSEHSIPFVWRVLLGYRPTVRWWVPRRRTVWWFASVGLAAGLVAANFVLGVRDPNLPSQTIDAGFHYNAVLSVLSSGLPDGGHVGAAYGAAVTSWYPPLWHDLTALTVSITGVNVAVGVNAVGWAIGGVVWPLSMVWLCSRILPHARLLTILALGLCCGAIALFPYLMLSFGVLWPNVLSLAALPALIALTLMVFRLMPRSPHAQDDISSAGVAADGATLDEVEAAAVRRGVALGPGLSWWTILFVGFLGGVGLFFAHPGALFALGIWAGIGVVMLSARFVVSSRAQGPRQLRRSLLLLLLAWSVGAGLWAAMNLVPSLNSVRNFKWAELMTMNQAMGQALTLSTVITKAHWAFGAATLWGFYRLLRVPRLRWLLVSHVFLVFLYMLCAGTSGWLTRELTGFFYNDAQRIAALIPMTAVPLAALGITSAADALGRFVGRVSAEVFGRPLSSRLALGIACLGMMAVPAVIYSNQGIGQGAAVLQDRYTNLNFNNHMVTPDEQALYGRLAKQIPAGETVLGSPFTGAQFSSIWSRHGVVIPIVTSNPSKDVALISQDFKSFTTDPAVCAALKRLKVGAVVDDFDRFWPTDTRQENYLGLVGLSGTPGLTPIGYGASVTIYRVGDCKS
ncbi:MAG TPA: DUF6541 family protein [Dermatophilaceae bacterium]|nr:DUF6541 family protein [Dermatophilaceae bacterium]